MLRFDYISICTFGITVVSMELFCCLAREGVGRRRARASRALSIFLPSGCTLRAENAGSPKILLGRRRPQRARMMFGVAVLILTWRAF